MCPYNVSRLIDTSDVASYIALDSLSGREFDNVVNIAPDGAFMPWGSNEIPNEGNLTLNQVFVIYQLTTKGIVITTDRYISKFSLRYSESDNGDYMLYPMVIIVLAIILVCTARL